METRSRVLRRKGKKASTKDVVGSAAPPAAGIPRRWRNHYDRLLALRDELLRRRGDLERDAVEEQPAFSVHMADAGTDAFDRDMALGLLSSEQDAVYQIDQALDRIRNDRYGVCELTGRPIESERLEAIPWTRFCAEAERRLEREGSLKRAALGPRATLRTKSASGTARP